MPILGAILAFVILLFGLGWVVTGNHLAMYEFFAPRYEAARRNTFEQSKAYRQGMVQELQQMQLDYVKANPEQQEALRAVIRQRTADLDPTAMPPDLWRFVQSVR